MLIQMMSNAFRVRPFLILVDCQSRRQQKVPLLLFVQYCGVRISFVSYVAHETAIIFIPYCIVVAVGTKNRKKMIAATFV